MTDKTVTSDRIKCRTAIKLHLKHPQESCKLERKSFEHKVNFFGMSEKIRQESVIFSENPDPVKVPHGALTNPSEVEISILKND